MLIRWLRHLLKVDSLELVIDQLGRDIDKQTRAMSSLQKMVKVGVDVSYHSDSWAVVCIAGKPDYVNFVNLGRDDINKIRQFLRQFEGSSRAIDLPHGIPKELFL